MKQPQTAKIIHKNVLRISFHPQLEGLISKTAITLLLKHLQKMIKKIY